MRYMIRPGIVSFMVVACATVSLAQKWRGGDRIVVLAPPTPTTPTVSTQGGVHLSGGRNTRLPWVTIDSSGYRWDISNYGTVNDGSNDAYDGGMQLQINGSGFVSHSSGRLSADGKEIEIGPWRQGNLVISRRIFVNTKSGYCRWIDIFENTTGNEITASLRYYSNMGNSTNRTHTTSGGANIAAGDWGIVTAGAANTSRPAIVHVFATPNAKFKPTFSFTLNNDNLYYNATIKVPANKAVALCFFEAQRRPYEQAVKFLKDFDPDEEMRLIPGPLRKIILNMDTGLLTLGGIELKRGKKSDLLVLRNGNEIHGRITNKEYVLRADFGQLKIPVGGVVGLSGRSRVNDRVHLVMVGGQIITGELTSGPVVIKLSDGTELKIAPKGLAQASYRISPQKPEQIITADSLAVFRSGARLAFDEAGTDFAFLTPHGVIKLSAGDLQFIEMDTPAGGLHRAVFRNGSTLAGLLAADRVRLKLKLGSASLTEGDPTLEVSRRQIKRFVFPAGPAKSGDLTRLTFRNADVIFGQLSDEKLTVIGKIGPVTVLFRDVAKAEFNVAAPGQVKLTMRDGTELAGKLADDYIKFKIEPGPVLKIFAGHIKSITGAAMPPAADTQPNAPSPTSAQMKFRAMCPNCGKSFIPKLEAVKSSNVKIVCPYCGTDLSEWYKQRRAIK